VDEEHLGQSRAKSVRELLLEMNPDVNGNRIHMAPLTLVTKNIEFFNQFSLVIATQQSEAVVRPLGRYLFSQSIPFLVVRSYGLIGYARVQVPEHTIVESHPNNDRSDIYIHPRQIAQWPELAKFCESFDFSKCDDFDHAHVPYIVILHQQMKKWLAEHKNSVPSTNKEKDDFKLQIRNARRTLQGGVLEEKNFEEAYTNAHRSYNLPEPEDRVSEVFTDGRADATKLNGSTPDFWILVAALNQWREKEGAAGALLPVVAAIPDMHSKTVHYVRLQQLFAQKAAADTAAVTAHVHRLLTSKQVARKSDSIPQKQIDLFVKNVRALRVVRTRPIDSEYNPKEFNSESVNDKLEEPWQMDLTKEEQDDRVLKGPGNIHWYFALRAVDQFQAATGRFPGTPNPGGAQGSEVKGVDLQADEDQVWKFMEQLYQQNGIKAAEPVKDTAKEIVRYGATEIHTVAAFMGGVGAQEGLKLLIKQYVPFNNTLLFNGIHASVGVYNL